MNEENYSYLSRQLKALQFPNEIARELKGKMEQNDKAFVITHAQKNQDGDATATLFFKKSENSDKYFFNNYHVNIKTESSPGGIAQTFYIDNKKLPEGFANYKRDFGFTEAINMLARADNKEEQRFVYGKWAKKSGELYNAWKGINIKEKDRNGNHEFLSFHDNYGFNLQKSLQQLPIVEKLKTDKALIKGLEQGHVMPVKGDNEQTFFLSANPPQRKINLFDDKQSLLESMSKKNNLSHTVQESSSKAITETNAQKVENFQSESFEKPPENKMAKISEKKMTVSKSDELAPKRKSRRIPR